MDSGTSSQPKEKGKTRRVWNRREEDALIEALRDISNTSLRCDNGTFRPGYTVVLEKALATKFPGINLKANPHIESKLKLLKKQYNLISDMLGTSGFGWNETTKCVEVEKDDIWETYLKKEPDAKGMKNKPFPHYDALALIFGKDRANGKGAEAPADAVEEINQGNTNVDNMAGENGLDDIDTSTPMTPTTPVMPVVKQGQRKRSRNSDGWASGLTEMAKTFGSFFEDSKDRMTLLASHIGYDHDMSDARRKVNGELIKLTNLNLKERLKAASLIVSDNQKVDLFFSLSDEEKGEWVLMLLAGII